jgi:glycosyltransferase involved in cell wall biosynthesis
MRVLVDATEAYLRRPRGMGKNIVDLYASLSAIRPDWTFLLAHQRASFIPAFQGLANLRDLHVDLPIPGGWRLDLWRRARLPLLAVTTRCDVLHSPGNTGPDLPLARSVATVHDLIPLEIAPDAPATQAWVARVRRTARNARQVITPSAYSKGRITEVLGVPEGRITVIPWAPDSKLRKVEDPAELDRVRSVHGLRAGEPYAFAFGAEDPRKNTARLIDAYAMLPASLRTAFRLLIVGVEEAAMPGFRAQAEARGVGERVVLNGFAAEADIAALLSGASLLCFPSRSEGFGLPILDAFRCGTPVLTSNRTSLPEVVGDAGVTVDPDSTEAIAEGLATLLGDEALRADLAARGERRVAGYTWDRVARQTAEVLERAAA